MQKGKCAVDDCGKTAFQRGWCHGHYKRWWRHGDPLAGRIDNGTIDRFIEEVVVPYFGEDCLIWPFGRSRKGYGGANGIEAHRRVCKRVHGEPPSSRHQAAHSCGNGLCVNPKHLRWATAIENAADRLIHGTHSRGEKSSSSKLTADQVREIRSLYGTMKVKELAAKFNVHPVTICNIQFRQTWAWLD